MPPTNKMIENALEALNALEATLTAEPAVIKPFQSAKLTWKVRKNGGGAAGQVKLNGQTVAASGSKTVSPLNTTTFSITKSMATVSKTLATASVRVDMAACTTHSVEESTLRTVIDGAIRNEFKNPDFTIKSTLIEIDATGVRLKVKGEVSITGPNPEVTVSAVIGFSVNANKVTAVIKAFDLDVDLLGFTLPEFLTGGAEGKAKKAVQEPLQKQVDQLLALLPANRLIHSVRTVPDSIEITICPKP